MTRSRTGFDYDRFIDDYKDSRAARGKKTKFSRTRSRLNRIRQNGIRAVETNVYQNQQPGGAGRGKRNERLLHLLIRNVSNLKAIIAHGDCAKDFARKASVPDHLDVFCTPHFASRRGFCNRDIDEFCQKIAKKLT